MRGTEEEEEQRKWLGNREVRFFLMKRTKEGKKINEKPISRDFFYRKQRNEWRCTLQKRNQNEKREKRRENQKRNTEEKLKRIKEIKGLSIFGSGGRKVSCKDKERLRMMEKERREREKKRWRSELKIDNIH